MGIIGALNDHTAMHIQTTPNQPFSVSHYDQQGVIVNQQKYNQSVLITSSDVQILDLTAQSLKNIALADDLNIKAFNFELLLIGGENLNPLSISYELKQNLYEQGVSSEIMQTGAACRTYNILLSEDRPCALMLIL